MDPYNAARPRARPRLRIGGCYLRGVLTEERDFAFEIKQVGFVLALGFVAGTLPKLQEPIEWEHVLSVFFADADIPGIGFADVQTESIWSHREADTDIAVAQQHTFKEIGRGEIANDGVAASNLEAVKLLG